MNGLQQPMFGFNMSVQPNQKLIMERFMYRDESFEGSLKEKADEYRMYPSQQSWEHIQKKIRRRNRTFNFKSFGLSTLLLLGFAIATGDDERTNNELLSANTEQQLVDNDTDDLITADQTPVIAIEKRNFNTTKTTRQNSLENNTRIVAQDELENSGNTAITTDETVTMPAAEAPATDDTRQLEKISAEGRLMSVEPTQRIPQIQATLQEIIVTPTETELTTEPAEQSTAFKV